MSRILLLIICLSSTFNLFSQEPSKESLAPCGTPAGISPWLRQYVSKPIPGFAENTEDTIWVALQVHLLGRDNGTGRFTYDRVLDALCRLNKDYEQANIQFYLKGPIESINKTSWYSHADIPTGIDMMLTNNVDSAFNSYFVADPAGNCGYNIPYAGVALSHGCAGAADHTWAHEAGHALSLPHPFIGWEGKVYNFNTPTPTQLTYDYTHFHDSIEVQVPAPLDTAFVELVDGSNCLIAADLFCDTKPDYLSYRWDCNAQNQSLVKQKDPFDAEFYSDGTLFMSYAADKCQSRFSADEIAAMRSNLATERSSWVVHATPQPPASGIPVAVEPIQDQPAPALGAKLTWSSVPNATYYLVQASRISNYAIREVDIITTDTSAIAGQLVVNKKYFWRVKAFNAWHQCADFTESSTFTTSLVSATYSADWEGWRCYPSLLGAGQALQLEIPQQWRENEAQVRIVDVAGRLMWEQNVSINSTKVKVELPSQGWSTGLYHLIFTSDKGIKRQPLFIQR